MGEWDLGDFGNLLNNRGRPCEKKETCYAIVNGGVSWSIGIADRPHISVHEVSGPRVFVGPC